MRGSTLALLVLSWLLGCKREASEAGGEEPEQVKASLAAAGDVTPGSSPLPVTDHAPAYVNTLASTSVLMDFETRDPALGHRLVAPKAWSVLQQDLPGSAGSFEAKPFEAVTVSITARDKQTGSPRVEVAVREVPFEVPVDALTLHALAGDGWSIERASWFPGPRGPYFDVVAVKTSGGVAWVRRTTARAAAGRILEVNAFARREDWTSMQDTIWALGAGFELRQATRDTRFENWRKYAGGAPRIELAHPESWQAEGEEDAPKHISAIHLRSLDTAGKVLLGYVQVRAVSIEGSAAATDARLAAAVQKLEKQNLVPLGPLRRLSEDEDPRSIAVQGWLGTFAGQLKTPDGSSAELRVGLFDRAGAEVQLVAISPTLGDDPIAAMRTRRAFEIARETLKL